MFHGVDPKFICPPICGLSLILLTCAGMSLQLLYVATGKASKLATNDFVRDRLSSANCGHLPLAGELLAGAAAGLSNVILSNPLEIVKATKNCVNLNLLYIGWLVQIRLQCAGQYSTPVTDTPGSVYRALGRRNLGLGLTACCLRDVPFAMFYFPAYAHLKSRLADDTGYNSPSSIFLAGALASAPAAVLVTPMDMIKTRIQVVRRPGQTEYHGVMDAASKIYREEGVKAFWKGNDHIILCFHDDEINSFFLEFWNRH